MLPNWFVRLLKIYTFLIWRFLSYLLSLLRFVDLINNNLIFNIRLYDSPIHTHFSLNIFLVNLDLTYN